MSEERKDIFECKFRVLEFVSTKRRCGELAFLLLQMEDTLFDCLLNRKFVNVHVAFLAEAVSAVECLVLEGGVPPEIDKDDIVATCEIQPWHRVRLRLQTETPKTHQYYQP